jgi:putative tricarboxylic transport membrane protein
MTREQVGGLVFLVLSVVYGTLAFDIHLFPGAETAPFTPRTWPLAVSVAGIAVGVAMLIVGRRRPADGAPKEALAAPLLGLDWRRVAMLGVLMVFYGLTIRVLGFALSTALFLFGGFATMGERRWLTMGGVALAVAAGFWVILSPLLGIYLDPGVFRYLG